MIDDATAKRAHAVFFSVLMVLSMVAVGFAAAPAAAISSGNDVNLLNFDDQFINSTGETNVSVDVDVAENDNAEVIVTYTDSDGDLVIAGNNSSIGSTGSVLTLTVDLTQLRGNGYSGDKDNSGTYAAHVVNSSTVTTTVGRNVDPDNALESSSASVFDAGDNTRSADIGDVYNGSTVYQGEDDLTFVDDAAIGEVSVGDLQKTAGDAEGTALNLPIAQDAPTGTYAADDGYSVIVQEPRITTAEVQQGDMDGSDISQIPSSSADNLFIVAEWNFGEAENLEVTVEDPTGVDITNQVLTDQGSNSDDAILKNGDGSSVGLDLADEDDGEYTVIFEGTDDLDYGGVVEEYTIMKSSGDPLSISVSEESVTQGDNVRYTLNGGIDGERYLIVIEERDYADSVSNGNNAVNIFRNVGDTVSVDNHTESTQGGNYAYAEVEIDGTRALGSIDTQYLADASLTVDVYGPNPTVGDLGAGGLETSVDSASIEIQSPDSTSINTRDRIFQGNRLDYTLSDATAERYYFLTINGSEFDLGITRENAANIFVNSNDVVEAGKFTRTEYINMSKAAATENADELFSGDAEYAYALVKSDTEGISGSINTEYLDSSQIEITVYNSTTGDFSGDIGELFYNQSGVDITTQSEQISSTSAEILPEEDTREDLSSSITPAQPSVDRSEVLDYTTSGLSAGDYHLVTIEKEEFVSSLSVSEASNIFTTGGQTVETGVANQSSTDIMQASDIEYAYALIEVDSTSPTGQINTEYLSGPTVDVNLFPAGEGRTGNQLTSPLDTSTVGFPSPEPSYNLTLENDGSVHSVGFPGPIRGDLNDLFVSGADGINAIYRFNSTTKSWEQQTELGRSPEELTAIAIVTSGTGPSEIQMKMAFDQRTVAVPGTRSLNTEGWHFVSPSSFDTPGTVFNRGTSRNSLVLDSFEGPQLEIAQTPATFQAQHGSRVYDMRSDNPPVMNPFEGYFVYITRRGDQPALIANADTRYELDSTLNVTYD